jgi:hypothetical protein
MEEVDLKGGDSAEGQASELAGKPVRVGRESATGAARETRAVGERQG